MGKIVRIHNLQLSGIGPFVSHNDAILRRRKANEVCIKNIIHLNKRERKVPYNHLHIWIAFPSPPTSVAWKSELAEQAAVMRLTMSNGYRL